MLILLGLIAEYGGVLGISTAVPGIQRGEQIFRFNDDLTIFLFGGKNASVGWLLVRKLDQKYTYPNRPHFTQDDAVEFCKPLLNLPIWGDTKFNDIWTRREQFAAISLEEGIFQHWHYGRIVCIGDSVNKVVNPLPRRHLTLFLFPLSASHDDC